jgi:hydrogenase nickel incorporation protein HypB
MMKIEVLKRLQEQSDAQADEVRRLLNSYRLPMFNVMGAPGSGKTTLLEATLRRLRLDEPRTSGTPLHGVSRVRAVPDAPQFRCAVLEGDLATLQDAERIAALDVPVAQLLTEGGCHLKPALVHSALQRFDLAALDCVFVENVGNLVCPANFDLGEHARVVVLSVAEGDDKITKYPYMFQQAGAVVISKLDLAPLCRFDLGRARRDLRAINPAAEVFELSAVRKTGLDAWMRWVCQTVERVRGPACPGPGPVFYI